MKVLIIGGVACSVSFAGHRRSLDEKAEILMVEKGSYDSYANLLFNSYLQLQKNEKPNN